MRRERQEDVDERPVEVDPEVPDGARRAPREAADDGREHGHAERGRDEVLHGEPGHLAQVRHRVLAAVVLPVRVRDEARGRVHRDPRVHALHPVRVEGQAALQPQQQVEEDCEDAHEDERRDCVRLPALLFLGSRSDEPVEPALGGGEPARDAQRPGVDARHVAAERVREHRQDHEVEDDLRDAVARHSFSPLNST